MHAYGYINTLAYMCVYIMHMCVLPAANLCILCVWMLLWMGDTDMDANANDAQYIQRPKEGIMSPATGVSDSSDPPCG